MSTIYTIGYSGWKPSEIRDRVFALDAIIYDIRYSPHSRWPEWERAELRSFIGARYTHLPALGNRNYRTGGEIQLAAPRRALGEISWGLERGNIIFLCGCKDHESCHRSVAAAYMAERFSVPVVHLYPGGVEL